MSMSSNRPTLIPDGPIPHGAEPITNAPLQLTASEKEGMEHILPARSNREIARTLGTPGALINLQAFPFAARSLARELRSFRMADLVISLH
jgi:hypothetical protein